MGGIFAVLFSLALFVGIVAVVGHALWLMLAWIFRSLSGQSATEDAGKPCPKCGARFGLRNGRCLNCGAVPSVLPGDTLNEELQTTRRQLNRLLDRGAISQQQHDEVVRVIYAELAGL